MKNTNYVLHHGGKIYNLKLNCRTLLFNNNCKGIWILHDRTDNHSLSYMCVKQNDNMAAKKKYQ
ncbi:hypothetical protein Hanom_Chr01g00007031 [Helianthus anomalus]